MIHRTIGRTIATLLLALSLAVGLAACAGLDFSAPQSVGPVPRYPAASFAVFSDPHLYLRELGIEGAAFRKARDSDRKMPELSESILGQALQSITAARPGFVLVTGDLTKDGEEADHRAMARALAVLRDAGIRAFVVPGNHDVNNPRAMRFDGESETRVPNVSPELFAEIYRDFGYGDAVARDPSSLAYVVEPEPGLWLLGIDACAWQLSAKEKHEHTAGFLTAERLAWLKSILERARVEGKSVIAFMHHGVVEHFPGQGSQFPEYLVQDYPSFGRMLAAYGVRVVFTGHFHAQNIAGAWWDAAGAASKPPSSPFIYDVETGSLSTYPCPWRLVTIDSAQTMRIRTSRVTSIPEMPDGFVAYALERTRQGTFPYIVSALRGYGIGQEEAERIAWPLTNAAVAHYNGDPDPQGKELYPSKDLSLMGSIAIALKKDTIIGMWTGMPPHADNDVDLDLSGGGYSPAR